MKILSVILGIIGLVMFVFGIASYMYTQTSSIFFYIHIFGGLGLLLAYTILSFKDNWQFLGMMLVIIISTLAAIITGTFSDNFYVFIGASIILYSIFVTFIIALVMDSSFTFWIIVSSPL